MPKIIKLEGQCFGRWVVRSETKLVKGKIYWLCVCSCETKKYVAGHSLTRGNSKSCGCLARELSRDRASTHGLSYHPLYRVWSHMKQRCYKSTGKDYKDYGGRGIRMNKDWKEDFCCFYYWAINNGWKKGLEIDRINNDGDYIPSNCRFATRRENCGNTRKQKRSQLPVGIRRQGSGYLVTLCLGTFKTVEQAEEVYNDALQRCVK